MNLTKIFDIVTLVVFIIEKIEKFTNRCKGKSNEEPQPDDASEIPEDIQEDSSKNAS